jgi:hypothetical protein
MSTVRVKSSYFISTTNCTIQGCQVSDVSASQQQFCRYGDCARKGADSLQIELAGIFSTQNFTKKFQ